MTTLRDHLLGHHRPALIKDCQLLIDQEVASKRGLSGLAVKGAYSVVKTLRPGILGEAIDRLLDEFVERMQPFFDEFQQEGGEDIQAYLNGHSRAVADALLGVTDVRIAQVGNAALKKAYARLRPKGQDHVEAAVPRIAGLLERYIT